MSRTLLVLVLLCACDGSAPVDGGMADAGMDDAGPVVPASTDHCTFVAVPPTGNAGGTVATGTLMAGTAEANLHVPLGASLAAYTSRAEGAGAQGFVQTDEDGRHTYLAQSFSPSIGIETIPRIRALALAAGGETVVILKIDLASSYQGFVHDVEAALGPEFSGKVMVASSHTHNSFGNYSGHSALAVGFGRWRSSVYTPIIEQLTAAARAAIDAMEPARIGFAYNGNFDPEDRVNRDRRGENDELAGGSFDDHHLYVIRVDRESDGTPMAMIPVFGMHGTLHDAINAIVSTDSTGGLERVLEEEFDSPVLVMHLQGAGGDVSPAGQGSIECGDAEVCTDFAKPETIGIFGRDEIMAAFTEAGEDMQTSIEIEMLTRTIPLGPDWNTFTIRDGALGYAPFDVNRDADNIVYDANGDLVSPIDEFNAPFGAALCSPTRRALMTRAQMPNTEDSPYSYRGCNRLEEVDLIFERLIDIELEEPPVCETTRTTVSALRLGDHMIATLPGEPVTLLVDHMRTLSPMPVERTIVVGYAQNHDGYLLGPEDWLSGGYEPEIVFWGPLVGEYIVEQSAAVMALAATAEREDGNAGGVERVQMPLPSDDFPVDVLDETPGTVPAALPAYILTRLLREIDRVQPEPTIERLESAYFTWIGEDPMEGTPRVFLQREDAGVFADVERRSGRVVQDGDLILTWTPNPIEPVAGTPRNHYYTVEFQAVPPLGTAPLSDRAGLPLGRYRFRIEGTGYELTSDPFEVVPATLTLTAIDGPGPDLNVRVEYTVPYGFRLLRLGSPSNGQVLMPGGAASVDADGTVTAITASDTGVVTVANGASATTITITDAFGNTGTLSP
jgi:neutral ceramidase